MENHFALFIGTFTTLLAVVNPFEALPIFSSITQDQDRGARRKLAFRSCLYALMLMIGFILFGTFFLKVFGVNLSMVRTVGGIILMKMGFDLFLEKSDSGKRTGATSDKNNTDPAFVPLAIPIMFGPGVLATILGMTSLKSSKEDIFSIVMISIAAVLCMAVMYLILAYAEMILNKIGRVGIDAATRITGFFIAAMGIGLIFQGIADFIKSLFDIR